MLIHKHSLSIAIPQASPCLRIPPLSDYAASLSKEWGPRSSPKSPPIANASPTRLNCGASAESSFSSISFGSAYSASSMLSPPQKQVSTFANAAADILHTQGVAMAYQMFGLQPPGDGLDPSSMFSGMLLGRMSTANGATDHFHGLLMLALQTLDTLACRSRANHSDVSECPGTCAYPLMCACVLALVLSGGRSRVVDAVCGHRTAHRPCFGYEIVGATRGHTQGS